MKSSFLLAGSLALVLLMNAPAAHAQATCATSANVDRLARELQSMLLSHLRMRPSYEQELRNEFARTRTQPNAQQVSAKIRQIAADPKTVELDRKYVTAKSNLNPILDEALRVPAADLARNCTLLERTYALTKVEEDARDQYFRALREALK